MKKGIALGCAVFAVLLTALLATGLYVFVWKPSSQALRSGVEIVQAGKEYAAGLARLGEIAELNAGIENREPFEPPADGELSAEQVERLVAVQRRVRREAGERLDAFNRQYDHISEQRTATPAELAAALHDFGDLAVEAKRVQVAALNEHGFSRQEYAWVRTQVLLALGLGGVSLNVEEVAAAVRRGDLDGAMRRLESGRTDGETLVPPANAALVEPYRKELEAWAPLAALGF